MQARDPICGMSVDTERTKFKGTYQGQPVYFCAASCQAKYEAKAGPSTGRPA